MRRPTVLIAVLGLLVAACGPVGQPRTLVPVEPAQRPMPANAGVTEQLPDEDDVPEEGAEQDCGDPAASLPPGGTDVPDGSTMDEIIERDRLIVGVDQNTHLFGFRDPTTGELEGFDIDIARELADALLGDPDKVQFTAVSVADRIPALTEGAVDVVVFMMTMNCERREHIDFSSVYYVAGQRVLVREDSDYSSLADLGGEPVCAPRGSTSSVNVDAADPRPELVEVDSISDCLVLLQQGQVEAISTDDTILAGMAEQDPTTEIVGEPISSEPYGIGIPKGNEDMVRYVNAFLEELREQRWSQLYATWLEPALGPAEPPEPTYR
ncbi:glutamate ABC transporter substrate-binding protein [Haloechinothrix sp. YIM 98757]|uniref:Glutamate ABC transporter substrate-binding protein n=1 Tax=Haloechinothrix aidingensis TaxID=2752311 RepID=A0A838AAU5_9PSEU|nr:glutamate ABC transporter substrate-binding protein [Haloechinothrix aidingensis]MBA0126353.1 glutamate ABC transporter substrate-binding protein [Haloechinothrix aidingensis]